MVAKSGCGNENLFRGLLSFLCCRLLMIKLINHNKCLPSVVQNSTLAALNAETLQYYINDCGPSVAWYQTLICDVAKESLRL